MGHTLVAEKIIKTLDLLEIRITERFPEAGLATICHDLADTARLTAKRVRAAGRPNFILRFFVFLVIALGIAAQIGAFVLLDPLEFLQNSEAGTAELTQALESGVNLVILAGAAIWFLVSLEAREKRRFVLKHLHELRSFAHVIDMHQLTKDPISSHSTARRTPHSPERTLTGYDLTRYLDYCSEMLSLAGKLAALYGEQTQDTEVTGAVNDIEILTAGISRKIWQKIMTVSETPSLTSNSALASRAAITAPNSLEALLPGGKPV